MIQAIIEENWRFPWEGSGF